MHQFPTKYDLEERTAQFGEAVIILCKSIFKDVISISIVNQLIRSGTSIGANYMEANGAHSKRDFGYKIFLCRKEAQETKHWLRMTIRCVPEKQVEITKLIDECQELILIFQKICSSLKRTFEN